MIRKVLHPIQTLDHWWGVQQPKHRLDRGPGYLCPMIPLWFYSASITIYGPVPNSTVAELSNLIQVLLGLAILIGCTIGLFGSLLGSKFLWPHIDVRRCYQLGYQGAPATAIGLLVYGIAIIHDTPNWTSAFGGMIAPAVGLSVLLNGLGFWLEVRRLNRVEVAQKELDEHLEEEDNG